MPEPPQASPQHHDPALYGDAFADVYDDWYSQLGDDDFVEAVAREMGPQPCRVLELGVGTGRLMHALHALRTPIVDLMTGVDSSAKMLQVATERGTSSISTLHQLDFSAELPTGPFDVIFVGYNTLFNLPSTDAIAACLSLVSNSLSPTGIFMTDLVIPHGDFDGEYSEVRTMANGDHVRSVSIHDPQAHTISGYFEHLTDETATRQRPWFVHYLLPHELDTAATRAGLVLRHRWADGHGSPFSADSTRHISTYTRVNSD